MTQPPLWKASIVLSKDQAADVAAVLELCPPTPQAVLIVDDLFEHSAAVEALYDTQPDSALLAKLTGLSVAIELLPDQDWIKASQEGLAPVRAGRFFIYGAHDAGRVPPAVIALRIEAGASDIDPVAVEVTRENAHGNGAAPLVQAVTADGLTHGAIRARAPFDLIVANILASPLTRLAPAIARALAGGGMLVLSGLLRDQENLVVSFYTSHGLILRGRRRDGPWSALVLQRPEA